MLAPTLQRRLAACISDLYLRLYSRRVEVRPLRACELDEAARLLSQQFCEREPLCRHLGMAVADLLPFFRDQVVWALRRDLTMAVFAKDGTMLAAATIDDHCDQYRPDPTLLTDALAAIGRLLDELPLPSRYQPKGPGEVFYCQLAATRPGRNIAPLFALLTVGIAKHLGGKGYLRAYAKVTNPLVLERMRRLESTFHRRIYEVVAERSERDFPAKCFAPLRKFRVTMVTWPATLL